MQDKVLFQPSGNGKTTAFQADPLQAMCSFLSWVRFPLRIPPDGATPAATFHLLKVVFDSDVAAYWQRLPAEPAKDTSPALPNRHRGLCAVTRRGVVPTRWRHERTA